MDNEKNVAVIFGGDGLFGLSISVNNGVVEIIRTHKSKPMLEDYAYLGREDWAKLKAFIDAKLASDDISTQQD